ncbi:MAG: DegV family protein [Ruminococcaceae bacterium]|nr:DegV family protein [Oscillospiraceae bacterium]
MANYVLSGCSTADLTHEHFVARDIKYVCFHYSLDDVSYLDDLGQTMPFSEFYQRLRDGAEPKTWQLNASEYVEYFTPFLEEGKDIFHLTISSGLSGTYNSALLAKRELEEKYPDRKIYIVDSLGASSGYGLFLDTLADMRDEGKSAQELYDWAIENRLKMHHWFFSTDLTFYIKGGRVSKTAGMVGTLLGICPLLDMNTEGKLIPRQKIRSKRKVIAEIVKKMEEHAQNGNDYSGKCYICHSDCIDDATEVKNLIKEKFPNLNGDIEIYSIGTTIGSHAGPGTCAVFFWGDERII